MNFKKLKQKNGLKLFVFAKLAHLRLHRVGLPDETLYEAKTGGAGRDRTGDLMNAIHALYQLSYSPTIITNLIVIPLKKEHK